MRTGHAIGQKLLWSFHGRQVPKGLQRQIAAGRVSGITLFKSMNVDTPAQVLELAVQLQHCAAQHGQPLLLIGADQEGGQLNAIGTGTTPLPGNMALGAAGSTELARQAGEVIGRELSAMGINLAYAPCCDINSNPHNPVIGMRSFGEEPALVARLAAAMVAGIQSCRVAATAKHFPGHGDTDTDSHHAIPVLPHTLERLRQIEFAPFAAAIQAGVMLVMTAHLALPALDGRADLPASMSRRIQAELLRGELGFEGVVVSDALNMEAIRSAGAPGDEVVRVAASDVDLLLMADSLINQKHAFDRLAAAVRAGQLARSAMLDSAHRVGLLKSWLAGQPRQPGLEAVGSREHQEVAAEIASQSITLVRDTSGLLPLHPERIRRLLVIHPRPQNVTPADTSADVTPTLAAQLRLYFPDVGEFLVTHDPTAAEISAALEQARHYDMLVLGTMNAYTQGGQADLARALLHSGTPTIIAALRLPYDLGAFPEANTYLCTYGLLEPSMRALARALIGQLPVSGRLPVTIPGLHPAGYGLQR